MLASLGHTFLLLALACTFFNVLATALSPLFAAGQRERVLLAAHRATVAVFWLLSAATVTLMYLFVRDDFSVSYVWNHSATTQPIQFKLSGLWSGQAGSLLLWAWVLGAYGLAVTTKGRREESTLAPIAASVVNVTTAFFVALIAFAANPFTPVEGAIPQEGLGLNPLLQNYWMLIHPPVLYFGYVGCAVPFAFSIAALLNRRSDNEWLSLVRRWTLFPWIVLTLGIIMGGAWAYETLGWGGYWAWDPVENASLMPWLTGTAFLHSIMIQARRGMLKTWNMVLVTLTFLLSIFGTFLTRSGVVSSVHSFAESNIGGWFLAFLGFALFASVALLIWRRDDLASETEFESPLSREGAFLLNNWILLGAAFAVLWGTVYPALSEAITGEQRSVGAPYFNRVMVPLGLVLLALTGIGPLMAWRKMSLASLLRVLKWPVIVGIACAPLFYVLSVWQTGAVTAFCLGIFVTAAIGGEFYRGAKARRNTTGESFGRALANLIGRNKARYGGYVVHLGIVVLFVGAAGNAFKIETESIELKPGQTMNIENPDGGRKSEYSLRFVSLERPSPMPPEKQDEIAARVVVLKNGRPMTNLKGDEVVMRPSIDIFKMGNIADPEARAGQEPQTARRPDIKSSPAHDLYLVLSGYDLNNNVATIKAYVNPLVWWIWLSQAFFIGGTIIALWPDKKRAPIRNVWNDGHEPVTHPKVEGYDLRDEAQRDTAQREEVAR
jgi:cytochrome c-type biogenesis protein CcmF